MMSPNHADSSSLQSLLEEACTLHENGAYQQAEKLYRELIEQIPGIWQLHYNRGLLLFETGRYQEALESYLYGLSIAPENEDLLFNSAICQKELGNYDVAIDMYLKALEIQPDDIDCLYNLAGCYRSNGDDYQAARIYQRILEGDPNHLPSLNNLAYVSHKTGDTNQARRLYDRILELDPTHVAAEYMRAALSGQALTRPPDSYVKEVFDDFAAHYETSLTTRLGYDLPQILYDFYLNHLPGSEPERLLDIGCGTGLVGEKFQPLCRSMTGIDISTKMLDAAHKKSLYDSLYASEIISFLSDQSDNSYDLAVSADVLPYIGELKELFAKVSKILAADGHFIFSVEHLPNDSRLFLLQQSGRFAHSNAYVRDVASTTGWQIIGHTLVDLRREREEWVRGAVYLMGLSDLK